MLVRVVVAAALLARGASLAPLRSTATRTPHSGYHGQGQIDFFEGWFSRLTLPDKSVALIYAVFDPGKKTPRSGVEAQILIAGADATATTVRASADTSRFAAAPHDLSLRYAFDDGDAFSMTSRRHRGRVGDVSWSFSVEPRVGWGGNFGESRQYSTAGWLAALGPLLSPHYQVLMSLGRATGYVEVAGARTSFAQAPFYSEKNWGRAFPKKWWWIQCNSWDDGSADAEELCLTATGARRGLLAGGPIAREEEVALIGVHWKGEFLPCPAVEWTVSPWGSWRAKGNYEDYEVEISAETDEAGCGVRVPQESGMVDGARETYNGNLKLTLRRGGADVVVATSSRACLETGGAFDDEWTARSEMAEPLRSIAYNVKLERAVADRMADAQRAGVVDVPGL